MPPRSVRAAAAHLTPPTVRTAFWRGDRAGDCRRHSGVRLPSCLEQFYDDDVSEALRRLAEEGFPAGRPPRADRRPGVLARVALAGRAALAGRHLCGLGRPHGVEARRSNSGLDSKIRHPFGRGVAATLVALRRRGRLQPGRRAPRPVRRVLTSAAAPAPAAAAPPAAAASRTRAGDRRRTLPAGTGRERLLNSCGSCHNLACSRDRAATRRRDGTRCKEAHKEKVTRCRPRRRCSRT